MSNRKNHEEEYQFPADEFVEHGTESADPNRAHSVVDEAHVESADSVPPSKLPTVKRFISEKRKVLLLVLAVIVVLVAFKFMTHPMKVKPASKPVEKMAPVVTPSPKVEDQIGKLTQVVEKNQNTIGQMQDQVDNMQTALSRANDQYKKTNTALKALTDQLVKLQKGMAAHPEKKHHVKKAKPIVFQLTAIVPGRAWVSGSNGETDTVSVGDSLPQYGEIKSINAAKGIVMTSSGKVIEYGVNDF